LALAALVVPLAIYLIHWLFGSRRRMRVPALFLWADLPQAPTARARRRLPPFSWLLVLQLLAATLAAIALARPASPSEPPRHVAFILDASASMLATDIGPTRFEAARASALARLNGLRREEDLATLIRAGREATLLASGSPDRVRSATEAAQPGSSTAAIREALALASSQIAATPERRGQIVLLTDGAFPPPEPIGPLAAPVEVVPTGGGTDNQAISSLIVRMDPTGRGQTAYAEIANLAEHAVRVPVRLVADDAPIDERQVEIAARTRTRLSIPLPADARNISVRLLGRDSLALDDAVDAIAPGGPQRDVLILGRTSDGLRRAIESIPSLRLRSEPARPDEPQADLTVLQASLPAQLPPGPLLLVDPPANSARLLGVGLGSGARVQQNHPLLSGLDLVALQNESPSIGGVPGWARVVLGTLQGPLIMEGRLEGHPVVALTFDPAVSGLEKSLAFPLLINNASSFLLAQTNPNSAAHSPDEPFDPSESDIAPRPMPTFVSVAQPQLDTNTRAERWPWFVAAVLGLLGAEWLVFARRG
jgi:hypothetical protein